MILHIANDYSGSTVYMNMVMELDNLSIPQIVYNPIRDTNRIGKNNIELHTANSQIVYSLILSNYTDRVFYRNKVHKIVQDIEEKIDLSKISYIHAHTWYSDGGAAYLLSLKYNIPYIVAIRNTDINLFFKYFIHERQFGKKILLNAKKIITISEVYKERILQHKSLSSIKSIIESKLIVIPNGVDEFWINNKIDFIKRSNLEQSKLLYIGKFDKGKNVVNLIKAVKKINQNSDTKLSLTLVGGGGNDETNVSELIASDSSINFEGKIFDKSVLLEIYKNHDFFVMPSKAETFGLVYVEAMLLGLPILYTANEGIDGFYKENIGEKILSCDVIEIEKKIKRMLIHQKEYTIPTDKLITNHNWKNIVQEYKKLYKLDQ